MATYTVHQAKTHLSQLLAEAERGEEVIIARRQKPIVRLAPIAPSPERKPGRWKGRIAFSDSFFDPLPDDELKLWNGE
jgi:prevent-host-death family protein